MPDEIDERVLEANLIKYLDERLEALKRHEIHGKWISTNKKIVVNHDDYWFIIWDLIKMEDEMLSIIIFTQMQT